ncbi:MAG: hypothetical protein Kow00121_51520 [Elainellaceae cyanobacterium]
MDLTNSLSQRYIELEFSGLYDSENSANQSNISAACSQLMHCSQIDELLLNFTLADQKGESRNLQDCIANKPAILLIHQGQPFNQQDLEFQSWMKALPTFNQLGITAIEIVPSIQSSLFASILDSTLKFQVLVDRYSQVAQSFTLVNSASRQHSSYQNLGNQTAPLTLDSLRDRSMRIICVIAADRVFFKTYASLGKVRPIDPMHYVTLLDPDYWLALS